MGLAGRLVVHTLLQYVMSTTSLESFASNERITAFNAALVLGACVLVQVDQKASSSDAIPDSTEDMTLHLSMALEALRHMDNDNPMVSRCRDYLEQFVQVVQALGKDPITELSLL